MVSSPCRTCFLSPGSLFRSLRCAADGWQILLRGICALINNPMASISHQLSVYLASYKLVQFASLEEAISRFLPFQPSCRIDWHNMSSGLDFVWSVRTKPFFPRGCSVPGTCAMKLTPGPGSSERVTGQCKMQTPAQVKPYPSRLSFASPYPL